MLNNKIFLIFIFIFFYKLFLNIGRLLRTEILLSNYIKWLGNSSDFKIFQTKKEVIELFKKANIQDNKILSSQGYVNMAVSLFENYPSAKQEFVFSYLDLFNTAIGVFKYRIWECFNPIYWLNCILFAPKHLLEYLGVTTENISGKFLNLILTVTYWIITAIYSFYSPKLKSLFIQLINEFFK